MLGNRLLLSATAALTWLSQVQADHHLILGAAVPDGSSGVPLRLNVNDLQAAAGPQWDLYIQAIRAMQDMKIEDKLSYFQTAGIHGKPFIQWDAPANRRRSNEWLGYCPHGEPIFLSWHRPYVMLFEEQLVRHATAIAQRYPESVRREYVAAAKSLRAPYWDWAADNAVPPASVPDTLTINIASDNGVKSANVPNPLQTYYMPRDALNGRYGPFDRERRPQTLRCPGQYPGRANYNIRRRNLKANLYAAFIYAKNFNDFAATANNGVGLEQIHNWIHYDASCGQQFWQSDLSAFDPLFMLHHANVDRLWAYWQYIRPDHASFTGRYYGASRYASRQGATITPESQLLPFFRTQGQMHTSNTVASINGMGYSYEGLHYWNMSSTDLRRAATALINKKYGSNSSLTTNDDKKKPSETVLESRYFVRFEIDRAHVERPCTVSVFFGGVKAGDVAVMAQPATGIMKGGFLIDDFVHKAAVRVSKLAWTCGGNVTVACLKKWIGMRIEITRPNGTRIPCASIPSFKCCIEQVRFIPPKSIEEFPTVGFSRGVLDDGFDGLDMVGWKLFYCIATCTLVM
ncbi:tyrosinase precursor [Cordyceps militaris]|uniref:Tyrosinase n=1 Tax=Cordyceps militaris TaxID=73501 RepID=A0A2H4S9M8_CORMI|nr:tyrosinase precursor [Cordyceps militaris]